MEFVVSKMNCSMEWEEKYYSKQYPSCKSEEELKTYLELRKDVYTNKFEKELEHCFAKKCHQNYATADLKLDLDKELLIMSGYGNASDIVYLTFSKKNEMVKIKSMLFLKTEVLPVR